MTHVDFLNSSCGHFGQEQFAGDGAVKHRLDAILPKLQRFARVLTGSKDAGDELVQQACERLLRRPDAYDGILSLENWMYRVINNTWIDEKRSMHTKLSEPLDSAAEIAGVDDQHTVDVRSTLARLRHELARLPTEHRTALMLVCVDGLSYQEAATVLAVPIGTLMSRLAQARLALAERLRQPLGAKAPVGKVG